MISDTITGIKESAVQSGISSEEAIGHTDYEIYGEERGEKIPKYRQRTRTRRQKYTAKKKNISLPWNHP